MGTIIFYTILIIMLTLPLVVEKLKKRKCILNFFSGVGIIVFCGALFAEVGWPWTASILVAFALAFGKEIVWDHWIWKAKIDKVDIAYRVAGASYAIWAILMIMKAG